MSSDAHLREWLTDVYGVGYSRADPVRAAQTVGTLVQTDPLLACAVGDCGPITAAIREDATWVNKGGGPLKMPPLVAATFSSLVRLPEYADQLRDCARLLLRNGADPNSCWIDPQYPGCLLSALYGAAGRNHDAGMTQILLSGGADPDDGESLYHSLDGHDLECTTLLLRAGARVAGTNALLHSLDREDIDSLRLLLASGADPNENTAALGTALHHSIRRARSTEHVRTLLEAGARPDLRNSEGVTPFTMAARYGRADIVELLRAGQVLPVEDQFLFACARGDGPAARQFAAENVHLIATLDTSQLRLLPELAQQGREESVRLMVELGWPVDVRGGDWDATALNFAVFQGNAEVTAFLLEHGAKWSEEHGYGDNAMGTLSYASRARPVEGGDWKACARELIRYGMPLPDTRTYRFSDEVAGFFATL